MNYCKTFEDVCKLYNINTIEELAITLERERSYRSALQHIAKVSDIEQYK